MVYDSILQEEYSDQVQVQPEQDFTDYLICYINQDIRVISLYQKIVPLIQIIRQLQDKIKSLDNVYCNSQIKDTLVQVKKSNESIQLIMTKVLLDIIKDLNYKL